MSTEKSPGTMPLVETFQYPPATVAGADGNYVPAPGRGHANFQAADQPAGEQLALRIAQAREEGVRQGEQRERTRWEQEISQQRAKITEALAAFERERTAYYSKIEAEVVHLALAIAAKILHREAQVDRLLLAGLVKVALEKLQQNTKVLVRVPSQQAGTWREYFAHNVQAEVVPEIVEDESLPPGNCVLETELGSTELSLESQLREVETGLFDLLAQRPDAR